jgi:hypothetical protein
MYQGTELEPGVQLIIYLDADTMAKNAEISIYSYRLGSGWVKLECVADPSGGWLTASVDYLDMVALLVLSGDNGAAYPEPAAPVSTVMPDTGNVSGVNQVLAEASLGVALSGTIAMTALAYVCRQRRIHRLKKLKK